MSPPPSGRCSARSASIRSPDRRRCSSSPTAQRPEWLAADLLAQAEHDTAAQAILMTDDAGLAAPSKAAVQRQLRRLPRGNIAGASWETFGAVIVVRSLDEAPASGRPHRRRAPRDRHREPDSSPRASATPAPSSSARTRRR
jgi:hypothetical protein